MITATRTMQPLPVITPGEGTVRTFTEPTLATSTTGIVHPLPVPTEPTTDLGTALRTAAFDRMLDRLGVANPLPIDDPTA